MLSKKPGPRTRCTSTQACRTDDATASTSPAGSSKFLASLASWRSIPSHRLAHAKRCGLAASSAALADGFPAGNRSNPLRRGTSSDLLLASRGRHALCVLLPAGRAPDVLQRPRALRLLRRLRLLCGLRAALGLLRGFRALRLLRGRLRGLR